MQVERKLCVLHTKLFLNRIIFYFSIMGNIHGNLVNTKQVQQHVDFVLSRFELKFLSVGVNIIKLCLRVKIRIFYFATHFLLFDRRRSNSYGAVVDNLDLKIETTLFAVAIETSPQVNPRGG